MMNTTAPAPRRIDPGAAWPLFDVASTRALERAGLASTGPHVLMQRAGLACARLALALHPHARTIWIAAGPGNNGGDGMEAALHLHAWGKRVLVSSLGDAAALPTDAAASRARAQAAGVPFTDQPPAHWDLCIDALLGIGARRAPDGVMARWIAAMRDHGAPVLSIDIPTGLDADTGVAAQSHVRATTTLSLLTLKPGLFTADGRDCTQTVWFDDLQLDPAVLDATVRPDACLIDAPAARLRRHASHKGSFGDVALVGGAPGMAGAALLAALAALHHGAGRVYLCTLDDAPHAPSSLALAPELMQRDATTIDVSRMTVVGGCGGGEHIRAALPRLLETAGKLVLDADGLNAVATDDALLQLLRARGARGTPTVLTPHPLEAARLLEQTVAQVQSNRLEAARRLAQHTAATVVLKGSGTIVATADDATPRINPTGNARLATPGSGDVLAGMIGAALAAGATPLDAACQAVFRHGLAAQRWPADTALTALELARQA